MFPLSRHFAAFSALLIASAAPASAQTIAALNVNVGNVQPEQRMPTQYAFCVPDLQLKSKDGTNINPAISWSAGPSGTQSYAVLMHDTEVPVAFDLANKPDTMLAENLPRQPFFHWVVVNIPANVTQINEGQDSNSLVKTGKSVGPRAYGMVGKNDYGKFMQGTFGGYDGPCPPWNDLKVHRYHFSVYALDIPELELSKDGNFDGIAALHAMDQHVLAKGEIVALYTMNPTIPVR